MPTVLYGHSMTVSMVRLLVCTPDDPPSANMRDALLEMRDWEELGSEGGNTYSQCGNDVLVVISGRHIRAEGIDAAAKDFGVDCDEVVFMSRHSAASGKPTLTVHPFGNYGQADFGGEPCKLSPSAPESMTGMLRRIVKLNDDPGYSVSFEVTHHGPLIETPGYFIEIGSEETHWGDRHAAHVLAEALLTAEKADGPRLIGVGGGHYAPRFTELVMGHRACMGHMVPTYQTDGMDDAEVSRRILDAFHRTGAEAVYIHRKSMKKSEERRIEGIIQSAGLPIVSSKDLESL